MSESNFDKTCSIEKLHLALDLLISYLGNIKNKMAFAKMTLDFPHIIHYYDEARRQKWVVPILYSDEAMLGIDKPSGLPVIPERWHPEWPCVQSILHDRLDEKPMIVHRIDAGTSGVMIFARTAESHKNLSEQFSNHEVEKTYFAIVSGEIVGDEQMIEMPIDQHPSRDHRMMISKNGKPALTELRVVERFRGFTLVEARPKTGRQHQIRVHLQAIGHPLIVDPVYGSQDAFFLSAIKSRMHFKKDEEERPLLNRLSLHAASLRFRHPRTGEECVVAVDAPKDFQAVVKALRKYTALKP